MKYLRRFVWYLASRLLLICCVLGLIVVTFYYAMNAANMSVVLKDGMAQRAKVVMMGEEPDDLNKYFLSTYLDRDEVLLLTQQGNSPYRDYTIRGIDHRLTMEWMWCWPWDDKARVDIMESIPRIDGNIKPSLREAALAQGGEARLSPPRWQSARYRVLMTKENGQWKVQGLTLLEVLK